MAELFDELKRRKMEMYGLIDEAELLAFEAIGDILHRQWLYVSTSAGYGDRGMAVRHLASVIRQAVNEAVDKVRNTDA